MSMTFLFSTINTFQGTPASDTFHGTFKKKDLNTFLDIETHIKGVKYVQRDIF